MHKSSHPLFKNTTGAAIVWRVQGIAAQLRESLDAFHNNFRNLELRRLQFGLTGSVIGQCLPRHRHTEFLTFLRTIDREVPKRLQIHLILDNYATHKHPKVKAWLAKHPRFHLHFTPTSSSWVNMVEGFFSKLTNKAIRRAAFASVPDLIAAIDAYLTQTNTNPTPFLWTKTADQIVEKVQRGRVTLNAITN